MNKMKIRVAAIAVIWLGLMPNLALAQEQPPHVAIGLAPLDLTTRFILPPIKDGLTVSSNQLLIPVMKNVAIVVPTMK